VESHTKILLSFAVVRNISTDATYNAWVTELMCKGTFLENFAGDNSYEK
jgi:hypothetical protein